VTQIPRCYVTSNSMAVRAEVQRVMGATMRLLSSSGGTQRKETEQNSQRLNKQILLLSQSLCKGEELWKKKNSSGE